MQQPPQNSKHVCSLCSACRPEFEIVKPPELCRIHGHWLINEGPLDHSRKLWDCSKDTATTRAVSEEEALCNEQFIASIFKSQQTPTGRSHARAELVGHQASRSSIAQQLA